MICERAASPAVPAVFPIFFPLALFFFSFLIIFVSFQILCLLYKYFYQVSRMFKEFETWLKVRKIFDSSITSNTLDGYKAVYTDGRADDSAEGISLPTQLSRANKGNLT